MKKKSPVLVMIIMLISMTAGAICMNKMGPVLASITSDLCITNAQSGLLVSIFVLSGIFLSIPMGMLTTKYGTLMGIVMCFMSFGQIIALNVAPLTGWRSFWWISAGFGAVGLILWLLFIRGIDEDETSQAAAAVNVTSVLSEVLKNGGVWMISLTFLAYMLAHMGVFNYLPTYLTQVAGMSDTAAASLTSLASLIGIPVGILGGTLADKWGSRKKPLALTMVLFAILIAALPVFSAQTAVVALVIYGIVAMAEAGLCMTAIAEVVPPDQVSTATAVVNTAQWTGAFLGATLFGAVLDATGWNVSFYIMAAIAVAGTAAILMAKKLK